MPRVLFLKFTFSQVMLQIKIESFIVKVQPTECIEHIIITFR